MITPEYALWQQVTLTIVPAITGGLSFVGSFLILSSITRTSKSGINPRNRLLGGLSLSDLLNSAAYIFWSLPIPKGTPNVWGALGNKRTCSFQGFLMQLGLIGAFYSGALSHYYYCKICLGMKDAEFGKKVEWIWHMIAIVWPIATASIAWGLDIYAFNSTNCWMIPYPFACKHEDDVECTRGIRAYAYAWLFMGVPLIVMLMFVAYYMYGIYAKVREITQRSQQYDFGNKSNPDQGRHGRFSNFSSHISSNSGVLQKSSDFVQGDNSDSMIIQSGVKVMTMTGIPDRYHFTIRAQAESLPPNEECDGPEDDRGISDENNDETDHELSGRTSDDLETMEESRREADSEDSQPSHEKNQQQADTSPSKSDCTVTWNVKFVNAPDQDLKEGSEEIQEPRTARASRMSFFGGTLGLRSSFNGFAFSQNEIANSEKCGKRDSNFSLYGTSNHRRPSRGSTSKATDRISRLERQRQESATQSFLFTAAYLVTHIFQFLTYIIDQAGKPQPFITVLLSSLSWPLQGFLNLFIFVRPRVNRLRREYPEDKSYLFLLREALFNYECYVSS